MHIPLEALKFGEEEEKSDVAAESFRDDGNDGYD